MSKPEKCEGGCPVQHNTKPECASGTCPIDHSQPAASTGCPVQHSSGGNVSECPVMHNAGSSSGSSSGSSWLGGLSGWFSGTSTAAPPNPILGEVKKAPVTAATTANPSAAATATYNEAANDVAFSNVPEGAQSVALNTKRSVSAIPKSDFTPAHQPKGAEKWVYPSEQQYYNAMKRKGYNPSEADVPVILAIHNLVNEQGWTRVREWEAMRGCNNPKLKKFSGRPNDLSPKARLLMLLGYTKPFDRHDWIIDRDGEEVRYVIDFYPGKVTEEQHAASRPPGHAGATPIGIHLDVRPALDSGKAVIDRVERFFREQFSPESLPKVTATPHSNAPGAHGHPHNPHGVTASPPHKADASNDN